MGIVSKTPAYGTRFECNQNDDGFGYFARQIAAHDATGTAGRPSGVQPGAADDVEFGVAGRCFAAFDQLYRVPGLSGVGLESRALDAA